jgi:trk system potassium uptake protein
MNVVIAGCGRVGSGLARDLVGQGFNVAIIDESPDAFNLLGDDFPGEYIVGRALDWDTLRRAGLDDAVAFVACTDGDNTNIVVAQIAQKRFKIGCVVARVYDPLRAELFAQAGIRTICPTKDVRVSLFDAVRACQLTPQEG